MIHPDKNDRIKQSITSLIRINGEINKSSLNGFDFSELKRIRVTMRIIIKVEIQLVVKKNEIYSKTNRMILYIDDEY